MSRLVERVQAWRRANPGGVLVAVSGGPDSVALLRALVEVAHGKREGEAPAEPSSPTKSASEDKADDTSEVGSAGASPSRFVPVRSCSLVVAHLNHRLRGADSDADEAFVRDLAIGLALPVVCHSLDVPAIVHAEGGNIEAVARRERYRWLGDVARERGLPFVATGHTASDQAETILHRLLRGCGLEGLRGIAFRRSLTEGVEVVRPLLGVTRADVEEYLQTIGQLARHDTTNDDTALTRNRIRHALLPLLARDYNPRVEEVLARLATQAEETFAEEEARAVELLARAEQPRAGTRVILDASTLSGASRGVVRSALRQLWRREGWPMAGMGMDHWEGVAAVCRGEQTARDLPGGVQARRMGGVVQLGIT